jgi:hypothetical protein
MQIEFCSDGFLTDEGPLASGGKPVYVVGAYGYSKDDHVSCCAGEYCVGDRVGAWRHVHEYELSDLAEELSDRFLAR